MAGRRRLTPLDDPVDLGLRLLEREAHAFEDARGGPLLLAHEREQDVHRSDVVVTQSPRLVLREDDDLAGPLGEPLEHLRERSPRGVRCPTSSRTPEEPTPP